MNDGTTEPVPDPPWHRRLSHGWWIAIEALVFVTVVFFTGWGADALARSGAEALLARNIQTATGVSGSPAVHVRGFAFVPQVVRGAYNEVEVSTVGITSGPLRIERVDSLLYDVRVPFHDVLVQDIRRVGIGWSDQKVTLLYGDINTYFVNTGRELQVAPGDGGELVLTGAVDVLSKRVQVRATATLSVAGEVVRINVGKLDTGVTSLDQAERLLLSQRLALTVPLGTLPFGHELKSVTVTKDAVLLEAVGNAIVLQP
jgi:LmeA-like phospholipid-binding